MKPAILGRQSVVFVAALLATIFALYPSADADPSKYPQFAQQSLPADVTPLFISIHDLVEDIKAGKRPMIIDVRSEEEYRELHILSALSAPLDQFKSYMKSIPKDRPVVLY